MYGQYKNVIDQQEYLISDNIIMKQLGRIMAYRLLKFIIITLMATGIINSSAVPAAAEDLPAGKHTEKEILGIIGMVEQELDGVKNNKAGEIADKEIQEIEQGIVKARKMLERKDIEQAFYQIEITRGYFAKIEARLELYYTKQILDQMKGKQAKSP